jgi:hypothetical protein
MPPWVSTKALDDNVSGSIRDAVDSFCCNLQHVCGIAVCSMELHHRTSYTMEACDCESSPQKSNVLQIIFTCCVFEMQFKTLIINHLSFLCHTCSALFCKLSVPCESHCQISHCPISGMPQ